MLAEFCVGCDIAAPRHRHPTFGCCFTGENDAMPRFGEEAPAGRRRHLAFVAIGASGQSHGAAEADELLAEGFGRD